MTLPKGNKPLSRAAASEPVLYGQLQSELQKFNVKFSQQLKELISVAVDKALEIATANLTKNFDEKVSDLQDQVNSVQYDLKLSEDTVVLLKRRISFLEDTALQQRLWNNVREQRSRLRTFRLHNKKMDGVKSSSREVYDFIVQPSFKKAVDAGDIDYIPKLEELCEISHPLRVQKSGDTPTHVFRFTSRYFYNIFMRYSREICAVLNDSVPDALKCRVGLDLSWLNRRCMSFLYKQDAVYRVRLSGHVLQFALKSDQIKWLTVKNPEASSIADMQVEVIPDNPSIPPISED